MDGYRWVVLLFIGVCVFLPGLMLHWRARGDRPRSHRESGRARTPKTDPAARETWERARGGVTVQSYEEFMQAFREGQDRARVAWWAQRQRDRTTQLGAAMASRLTDLEQGADEELSRQEVRLSQRWTPQPVPKFFSPASSTGPLVRLVKLKSANGQRDQAIGLLTRWVEAVEGGGMSVGEAEAKTMVEMLVSLYRTENWATDACHLVDRWLNANRSAERSSRAKELRVLLPQVLIMCGHGVHGVDDECRREGQRLLRDGLVEANRVLGPQHPAVMRDRTALG